MAPSSPATACLPSAALPTSARSRSRRRAASMRSCCAAASWSAKSAEAPSSRATPGAAWRRQANRAASGSISSSIIRLLPDQTTLIAKSLEGLEKSGALDAALRQATSVGTPAVRSVAAAHLSQGAWSASPEQLVFTGNGRQSIAAALAAVVPAGGRCGVEALTYPFIKGIAARLGYFAGAAGDGRGWCTA